LYIINNQGSSYAIEQLNTNGTNASGDGFFIRNLQIEGTGRNLLYLAGNNNAVSIEGVINGFICLKNGYFNLENFHIEVGNIIISNASINAENMILYHDFKNATPLTILTDNGVSKPISLKNINFSYPYWQDSNFIVGGTTYANIKIDPLFNSPITLENCKQVCKNNSQGLIIMTTEGLDLNSFNANFMSVKSTFNSKTVIANLNCVSKITSATNFFDVNYSEIDSFYDSNSNKQGMLWLGNSGTYYYKIGLLIDWSRKIGTYDTREFAIQITNTDRKIVDISILNSYLSDISNCSLIIFRGTTTGVYNKISTPTMVDTSSHQFDNYKSIFLGAWNNNTNSNSSIYTLNFYRKVIKNLEDNTVICYGTVTPTAGLWQAGDRIINTNIAVGQVKSWICSVSGSPGTWISEGTY
jgi:hypothetical protein